uniref:TAF6-like RNA polymerase II p300/CBP-associated factor-associated factor 65 kDa subunit 6L n=1 Tax=Myxine glutinosa TaxID=7769 RepID=UPI00358F5586
MTDKDDKRFAEIPKDSIKTMAESVGISGLADGIAAMLAEDVCYRLREMTQTSCQFMKHSRRKKLTVEDFNRALHWSSVEPIFGYGSTEPLPFRSLKEGDYFVVDDREVNLVDVSLSANVPKECPEKQLQVYSVSVDFKTFQDSGIAHASSGALPDDMLHYYQRVTKAILGDDMQLRKIALQDLQTNAKIASLLPYFVSFVGSVKTVSHDLGQLSHLMYIVKSLLRNPYIYLGPFVHNLISSVSYCILEPLAASINPLNDHWVLRDYAALLLAEIVTLYGDTISGLEHQVLLSLQEVLADSVRPLCSHYGAVVGLSALGWKAVERILYPHLLSYWSNLQLVLDDCSVSNSQVKDDGHKVYGAIVVAVEKLISSKAVALSVPDGVMYMQSLEDGDTSLCPNTSSNLQQNPSDFPYCTGNQSVLMLQGDASGSMGFLKETEAGISAPSPPPLSQAYDELYELFGDSLALRFGTGGRALGGVTNDGKMAGSNETGAKDLEKGRHVQRRLLRSVGDIEPSRHSSPRGTSSRTGVSGRARHRAERAGRGCPSPTVREVFQVARPMITNPTIRLRISGAATPVRSLGRSPRTQQVQTPTPAYSVSNKASHNIPLIGKMGKVFRGIPRSEFCLAVLL